MLLLTVNSKDFKVIVLKGVEMMGQYLKYKKVI